MKFVRFFVAVITMFVLTQTALQAARVVHDVPEPIVKGETIRLELNTINNNQSIYNVRLFYRMQGDFNYKSQLMKNEGLILVSELNSRLLNPGNLEYYFAYQEANGSVGYLPENSHESNPFRLKILAASQNIRRSKISSMNVLMISPHEDEMVAPDDFLIAMAVPLDTNQPERLKYKLIISGVDVSKFLKVEGNLISFIPKTIRSGLHNAEFKVFDNSGTMIGEKKFSFRISGVPSRQKGFDYRASLFVNNRYQEISNYSRNDLRAGFNFFSSYRKLDMQLRFIGSSEDAHNRQPINQYSVRLRYNFSPDYNFYVKGGDIKTNYDPLVFWEKRIRGIGSGINTKFFNLDYTYGHSLLAVEGKVSQATADQTGEQIQQISIPGTYKKTFLAIRPEFKFGSHFNWSLNLVNGKDDPESIQYGSNPKESLVLGSGIQMNMDKNRIILKGSFNASIKNEDAVGEVDFDTLAERYDLSQSERDQAETFINIFEKSGFLTLTQGLSPLPSYAMQFETQLRYFNHNLRAAYKKIDAEYRTPGNPYLLKDISGIFISDNIHMLNNQVFLNIYFKSFDDNLSQDDAKTNNTDVGGSISYFPFQNVPSVTLSYGNQIRSNDISPADSSIFLSEDNSSRRIGLSTNYNLQTGTVNNALSFSATQISRDDAVYDANQSEFTILSIGLRNRFSFPLSSRFSFAQTASSFGKSETERQTDIQKFFFGLDYQLSKAIPNTDIKPYINYTFQTIKNDNPLTDDYDRINYTAGLYLRNSRLGNLTIRYDYLDFGHLYEWKDSIVSTRYELSF